MSTESWYTTRNSSTWFEASDAQAWIPAQNASSGNPLNNANMKNLKTGKSDSSDRGLKEQKLEQHRAVVPPQSDLPTKFFELPSNLSVSDQNAWNAYVLTSSASADGWDKPNDKTPVPDKTVVFSKLKRNIDIEAELTKQNLYKTELCQSWMETGSCRYGTKCQFAHGKVEVRPVIRHPKYKTEVCKTFSTTGQCPYGKRCRFVHQLFELRNDGEDEDNIEEEAMLQRKLQEISLSLSPDPVFSEENSDPVISPNHVKKGSRLPFLQKLRKQL
jgi:butyrate response factor 1